MNNCPKAEKAWTSFCQLRKFTVKIDLKISKNSLLKETLMILGKIGDEGEW